MNWEFATANRIVFGEGKRWEAAGAAREFGGRALIVTGANPARAEWLLEACRGKGMEVRSFAVSGEPEIGDAAEGVEAAREFGANVVIGHGGGSAVDAGKAIAALAVNPGPILDYLEVIGLGKPLREKPLPYIAIPTTAGTGAEATRNAVLSSPGHQVKVSLRSPLMLPARSVIDPELTYELPPELTAATGMDALTQLIEPFVCTRSNPLVDGLCREGLRLAAGSLRTAFAEPRNVEARRNMALASLFGGMALANAGLGAVHGFAAPIGGMFEAPHGSVCAALLPHVMEANCAALRKVDRQESLDRYREAAAILTEDQGARAEDGVEWVASLCRDLAIAPLGRWGIRDADLPVICERAAGASSMKANPVQFAPEELLRIVQAAL